MTVVMLPCYRSSKSFVDAAVHALAPSYRFRQHVMGSKPHFLGFAAEVELAQHEDCLHLLLRNPYFSLFHPSLVTKPT
jgi:hypothetical protein